MSVAAPSPRSRDFVRAVTTNRDDDEDLMSGRILCLAPGVRRFLVKQ